MESWFPQAKQTATEAPRLRLVTFPNAGSAENVYTGSDKTAFNGESGRRDNALMKWAKASKVEVYAAQPPGREMRIRETPCTTAKAIAEGCFAAIEKTLFAEPAVPWALFAHSMGTWAAYEFVKLCPVKPTVMIVSGFASPAKGCARPWNKSAGMTDDQFKEECPC